MNSLLPPPDLAPIDPVDEMLLKYFADICERLDLTPTQWGRAKEAYQTLGRLLCDPANPLSRFKPNVYPQGSARLQTTNRPLRGDEFDIDLICELLGMHGYTVEQIFQAVRVAIEVNKQYAGRVSLKNRCVRIRFPNDFYLDVTPAVPDDVNGPENISITDRPSGQLKASNPKDYCDAWFLRIASVAPRVRRVAATPGLFGPVVLANAKVEPVKTPQPMRPVLMRFIQLFKRHRDVTCDDDKNAPISAIITTTAALAYAELSLTEHDSLYDLMLAVAERLPTMLGPAQWVQGRLIHTCLNSKNPRENFADKWQRKPERQDAFFAWQRRLVSDLRALRMLRGEGLDVLHRKLAECFGEDLVRRVTVGDAQTVKSTAAAGALGIAPTGLLLPRKASVVAVRPQTFHGGLWT